jgi:ATP-dependent DNA ligase
LTRRYAAGRASRAIQVSRDFHSTQCRNVLSRASLCRSGKPPKGPEWVYEIKWDSYRLTIHIEPQSIRILTRGGHDWTHRFPSIAECRRRLSLNH